jgi:hypothetical protein
VRLGLTIRDWSKKAGPETTIGQVEAGSGLRQRAIHIKLIDILYGYHSWISGQATFYHCRHGCIEADFGLMAVGVKIGQGKFRIRMSHNPAR